MSRLILSLLLLLAPLAVHAGGSWSSTDAAPAVGWLSSYESTASVSLNASTYTAYDAFDVDRGYSTGGSLVTTGSNAITIGTLGGGLYLVEMSMSFQGTVGEYHCDVFVGAAETPIAFRRSIGTTSQFGVVGASGILRLVNGDALTVKCKAEADETMQADTANLVAVRVGP